MKSKPKILKVRLFVLAGVWIGLALGLSWVAMTLLFERHTERQITAELIRHGETLAAASTLNANGKPIVTQTLFDPRFARPASGLYWHLATPSGEVASRSLWDGKWVKWPEAAPHRWQTETTSGPFEARIIRVARAVRPNANGPSILIEVGLNHDVITRARADFARELGGFLVLLWGALTLASVFQVAFGLAPLGLLQNRLLALKANSNARLDETEHLTEVGPLIETINALADTRALDMERARARARDLAHALKTPLTALKMQVADLDDPATQTALGESVAVLNIAVQAELARAHTAHSTESSCQLLPLIERLVSVVRRTPNGTNTQFDLQVPVDCVIPLSQDGTFEVFGALLDNATRHAKAIVRIRAQTLAKKLSVWVEDDGAGLNLEQSALAVQRGTRLDEAVGTQGLGLAIVKDLVMATGGTLMLNTAALGGLSVKMTWAVRE
jgi:signal transduction histidine kinase